MVPQTVKFTEVEIETVELLFPQGRKKRGHWPADWTRHQFTVDAGYHDVTGQIDQWLAETIEGRWGSYSVPTADGYRIVVIAFEQSNDAVMFRLMDGERAALAGASS